MSKYKDWRYGVVVTRPWDGAEDGEDGPGVVMKGKLYSREEVDRCLNCTKADCNGGGKGWAACCEGQGRGRPKKEGADAADER